MDHSGSYWSSCDDDSDFSAPDCSNPSIGPPATFASLLVNVMVDASVSVKQRRDERSALTMLFRVLDLQPETRPIIGDELELERLLRVLAGRDARLKGANLRNIRSRCRTAYRRFVAQAGLALPPAVVIAIPPCWVLVANAFPRSTGFSPTRFIQFAVKLGLEPPDISNAVLQRYAITLEDLKHPRPHLARLVKGWNAVAANAGLGVQSMSAGTDTRETYSVRLGELHPDLQEDIENYFGKRTQPRRRQMTRERSVPLLKPSSADKSVQLLRQYLGLLRQKGVDIVAFESLTAAVTLDHVETATYAMRDRLGDGRCNQLHNMLCTLSSVARDRTHMPEAELEVLANWISDNRPAYDGMVDRNVKRLLVLKDPRNLQALLSLPSRLMMLARPVRQRTWRLPRPEGGRDRAVAANRYARRQPEPAALRHAHRAGGCRARQRNVRARRCRRGEERRTDKGGTAGPRRRDAARISRDLSSPAQEQRRRLLIRRGNWPIEDCQHL